MHFDALFRYGRKIARDSSSCEDAIQELFIKLWNSRGNLGPTDNIKNYLFTSLRRLIIRNQNSKSISTDPQEMRQHDEEDHHFEALVIQGEEMEAQSERLKQALEKISSRQREVIYLRFYQNMDYDEICEVMGISYQGARNMLFKAVKNMKKYMALWFSLSWMGYKQLDHVFNG